MNFTYNDIVHFDTNAVSTMTRDEKRQIVEILGECLTADVLAIPPRHENQSIDRYQRMYEQMHEAAENRFRTELRRLGLSQ